MIKMFQLMMVVIQYANLKQQGSFATKPNHRMEPNVIHARNTVRHVLVQNIQSVLNVWKVYMKDSMKMINAIKNSVAMV